MKMKARFILLAVFYIIYIPFPVYADDESSIIRHAPGDVWTLVKSDYEQFYSLAHLIPLGIAFGAGAIIANTELDGHMQDWYQNHVRSSTTDNAADTAKVFGEGKYVIPLSLIVVAGNYLVAKDKASSFSIWGERSLRSFIVGVPVAMAMQNITGGARPSDDDTDSHWRPFKASYGVSGHAFIGAVPFLTLARMHEKDWYIKYPLYVVSALPALSRINDNQHYPSQAALGWFIAWQATGSIAERDTPDTQDQRISFIPLVSHECYGLQVLMKW